MNVAGLAAGTYNAAITVSASGATNTPQTIPVSLIVAAAPVASPTIAVSPSSFTLTAQAGSTTVLNQTLTITNTGGDTFNWTVIDDSNWVTKNVGSGSGNGTVLVSVNPTGLAAGTHTSLITVSATGATNTPQVVPVTLTLTAPPASPTIGLSPTSLAFSGTTGGSNPASKTITVTNTGTGTLSWTVADNANWLTATQSGSTITAAVNLSGLAAGTYNGAITVSATGATNTPQTVPVSLTVPSSSSTPTTGSVTLTWNANSEQDLGGYEIYRATSSSAYGAPIATINGNVTSYVASGLPKGTTYFFVVTASDNAGNESSYSNEVSKSVYYKKHNQGRKSEMRSIGGLKSNGRRKLNAAGNPNSGLDAAFERS